MASPLLYLLDAERILFRLALACLCYDRIRCAFGVLRSPHALEKPPIPEEWPSVTVQVPILNEQFVVERMMRAVGALDYPKDKLLFQVLDDSDDETMLIIDRVASELRILGTNVMVVRRKARTDGAKAGLLTYGLRRDQRDLVAMFDADFCPPPSFLKDTVPYLVADPGLGLVQTRQSFVNSNKNVLTRTQEALLDGLYAVEQTSASRGRGILQFNGAAGVWRRQCINDVGGWTSGSATEDKDISIRALLKGWRFLHLPEVAVATELPETMSAFRAQQKRWLRGNVEVLRGMLRRIASSTLTIGERLGIVKHLAAKLVIPLVCVATITYPLTTFRIVRPPLHVGVGLDAAVFAGVAVALGFYFAQARRWTGQPMARALLMTPFVIALYIGLSFTFTIAIVSGLVRKNRTFVRTPKPGTSGVVRYRSGFDWTVLIELVAALLYAGFTALACSRHLWVHAAFSQFIMFSFLWAGGTTLAEKVGSWLAKPEPPAPPIRRVTNSSMLPPPMPE